MEKIELIDFEGKKIATWLSGNGTGWPLVLVPGFCEDSRIWEDWMSLFSGRKILRIDLPGFGSSDYFPNVTIDIMARIVKKAIDYHGIKKCLFIGHSMGGYVALAFAEKYLNNLHGLCLFHSHPFADSAEKREGREKSIEFIKNNGPVIYVRQVIPTFFAYNYIKGYQMEVNRLIHHAKNYSESAIIDALKAMANRPDRAHVLQNLNVPVLFIVGKKDQAVTFEQSLNQIHLPKLADVRILPLVGHMGMFEATRETVKAVREFISTFE